MGISDLESLELIILVIFISSMTYIVLNNTISHSSEVQTINYTMPTFEYNKNSSLTKDDLNEINYRLDLIENQLYIANNKLDNINDSITYIYNTYNFYFKISIALNIILTFALIDSLSYTLLDKSICIKFIINKLKKK
jgi:hypothetical protein